MFCPRCAYEIQDSQTFCWRCGFEPEELTRIRVKAAPLPPIYSQPEAPPRVRNKVAAGAAAGAFASLAALGLGCLVVLVLFMTGNMRRTVSSSPVSSNFNINTDTSNYFDNLNSNISNTNLSTNSPNDSTSLSPGNVPSDNLSSPPPELPIVNTTFVVAAQRYVYYAFNCPSECMVTGSFQAQGGSNNIHAYILDDVGFANMQRRTRARNYYNSGTVAADSLSVRLRSGSYFLVFDNTQALFTAKAVSAQITASF